jgi:DNA-binding response OmpR family regulator
MKGVLRLVAIVDDDPGVCRALQRLVRALGHEAHAFASGNALLYGNGPVPPTDILLDLHMPGPSGPPLVSRIRARWPEARILVMSGLETQDAAEACLAAGALQVLAKPIHPAVLDGLLRPEGRRAD